MARKKKAPTRKKCGGKCGSMKPASAYGRRTKSRDGLQSWCKDCMREAKAAKRAERTGKATPGTAGQPQKISAPSLDGTGVTFTASDVVELIEQLKQLAKNGDRQATLVLLKMAEEQQADGQGEDPLAVAHRHAKLLRICIREIRNQDKAGFHDRSDTFLDQVLELGPEGAAELLGIEMAEA